MDRIDELNSKIEEFNKHSIPVLCRYRGCKIMDYAETPYVQALLEPLSDEPDFVEIYRDLFYTVNELPGAYQIRAATFSELMDKNFMELDLEDQKKELDDEFTGALVVIKPVYKAGKDAFYKNGFAIRKALLSNQDHTYYLVPVMDNREACESLMQGEDFEIPTIDSEDSLMPKYLCYESIIYIASLKNTGKFTYKIRDNTKIKTVETNFDEYIAKGKIVPAEDSETQNFFFFRNDFTTSDLKKIYDKEVENQSGKSKDERTVLEGFQKIAAKNHFFYSLEDIENFHTCVKSGNLTILAGMAGTGKTRLPLLYANYFGMTEEKGTLLFIPVSPSYLEPSDLLGYMGADHKYVPSETGIVQFLIHASKNKKQMHMVILDEMNLAPIEYYFSPFISLLERKEGERKLRLYDNEKGEENDPEIPSEIDIFDNVIFVGTINMDETTKNMSDRLLDRAFVVKLNKESFVDSYKRNQDNGKVAITEDRTPLHYSKDLTTLFEKVEDKEDFFNCLTEEQVQFLEEVHQKMNFIDSEKGVSFRETKHIAFYLRNSKPFFSNKDAFDLAFLQTFLRKINGSSESLKMILGELDDDGNNVVGSALIEIMDKYPSVSSFQHSKREIETKVKQLERYGFVK